MSNNESPQGQGIGLLGATFIVFLVLKLTDNIDWSWWMVSAPLWGPFALLVAIVILVGIPYALYKEFTK